MAHVFFNLISDPSTLFTSALGQVLYTFNFYLYTVKVNGQCTIYYFSFLKLAHSERHKGYFNLVLFFLCRHGRLYLVLWIWLYANLLILDIFYPDRYGFDAIVQVLCCACYPWLPIAAFQLTGFNMLALENKKQTAVMFFSCYFIYLYPMLFELFEIKIKCSWFFKWVPHVNFGSKILRVLCFPIKFPHYLL